MVGKPDRRDWRNMSAATAPSLRTRLARAALTSGGGEVTNRLLTITLSIVAARMLAPADVGVLGVAVTVVGVISMLATFAETAGIVASGPASHRNYARVATALRAAMLAAIVPLVLLGLPSLSLLLVGKEGRAGDLVALVEVLLWLTVVDVVTTYPRVVLQRSLELTYVAAAGLLGSILNVAIGVSLLLRGRGTLGMAEACVAAASATALVCWVGLLRLGAGASGTHGWRGCWREVAGNALKLLPGGFTGYLNQRVDNLLVSSAAGPSIMSFYSMAWNAGRLASGVVGQSLQFVLVPAFARMRGDRAAIDRSVFEALRHSYFILSAASALLFAAAPELVELVLGPRWLPMVPALRLMCVTVLAGPPISVSVAALVGLGRAHLIAVATSVHLAVMLVAMIPMASRWGVVGAALCDLFGTAALALVLSRKARGLVGGLGRSIVEAATVPLVAAVASAAVAWSAGRVVSDPLARASIEVSVVGIAYLVTFATLGGRAQLAELHELLGKAVWHRPARAGALR